VLGDRSTGPVVHRIKLLEVLSDSVPQVNARQSRAQSKDAEDGDVGGMHPTVLHSEFKAFVAELRQLGDSTFWPQGQKDSTSGYEWGTGLRA
jgi:hypothetical protein